MAPASAHIYRLLTLNAPCSMVRPSCSNVFCTRIGPLQRSQNPPSSLADTTISTKPTTCLKQRSFKQWACCLRYASVFSGILTFFFYFNPIFGKDSVHLIHCDSQSPTARRPAISDGGTKTWPAFRASTRTAMVASIGSGPAS